ncbi:MAG: hypothetical protein K2Q34_01140 [Alphaproteobacteria bacterium]|nr:hypothetical protein [Alphaproteobacteria bacterium]
MIIIKTKPETDQPKDQIVPTNQIVPSPLVTRQTVVTLLALSALYLFVNDSSWALQADDAMKATSEALEKTLTGSWLRIGLLAGMIGGVVMSAVKQSPIIFAGSMGTGLGALYYKGWVTDSFAALI